LGNVRFDVEELGARFLITGRFLTIEHSLLPPDEFDDFQDGWAGVCDQLAAFLRRKTGVIDEFAG
jgi:hypothetical protein